MLVPQQVGSTISKVFLKITSSEPIGVLIIGSAQRPQDFDEGSSLVDVVAVVSSKPSHAQHMELRRELVENLKLDLNLIVLTPRDLIELAKSNYHLSYYIAYDSTIVYGRDRLESLCNELKNMLKPSNAVETFKRLSLTHFSIALEYYLRGLYMDVVNHLYKSLKAGMISYTASKGILSFTNDALIETVCRCFKEGEKIGSLLKLLRRERRDPLYSKKRSGVLIDRTSQLICKLLQLEIPNIRTLLEGLRDFKPLQVALRLEGDRIKLDVKGLSSEGRYERREF
ncbi:MAG: hypothetical protein DRN53_02545 [Thermoprotei archaeon]|nr:MAG: hypothetical protein DRN53_02545 [Thermoprotei archaeon]